MENEMQKHKEYASEKFGIPMDDVIWYNAGICYDRVCVKSKESADKVTAKVQGQTANGGMFHGMPLGGQSEIRKPNGIIYYDITC